MEDARIASYFGALANNDLGIPQDLLTFLEKVNSESDSGTTLARDFKEDYGEDSHLYREDFYLLSCNYFANNLYSFRNGLVSSLSIFRPTLTSFDLEVSTTHYYGNGNFKWSKKEIIPRTFFLDSFLFYTFFDVFGGDISLVAPVRRFVNSLQLKSEDNLGIRYSRSIPADGSFIRSLVDVTNKHHVIKEEGQTLSYLKDSPTLSFVLDSFVIGVGDTGHQFYSYNPNKCFVVEFDAFMKMRFGTKLFIVSRMVHVTSSHSIFVPINPKQEVGNYGRRYNNFNPIPRNDRALMDNIYGVDMEQALQRIVWWLLKDEIDLPMTRAYIDDKKGYRAYIAQSLDKTIDEAKTLITAIYQGDPYTKARKPMKPLYDEAKLIKVTFFKRLDESSEPARYAKYRMKKKAHKTIHKKQKAFMFFYWSWYERELQNIICKRFNQPITLHDGVYTQNKDEFDALDVEDLEREMNDAYDMSMKLSRC